MKYIPKLSPKVIGHSRLKNPMGVTVVTSVAPKTPPGAIHQQAPAEGFFRQGLGRPWRLASRFRPAVSWVQLTHDHNKGVEYTIKNGDLSFC